MNILMLYFSTWLFFLKLSKKCLCSFSMSAHVQQQNISIKCQLYSVPRYLCSTFGGFKKKIYIRMKEVILKSMKGKMSMKSSLTLTLFFTRKKCINENKFLTEIYNGECLHRFSIWKSLRTPRAIFQRNHPGLLACKFPVDFTRVSRVLKTDKLTGAF